MPDTTMMSAKAFKDMSGDNNVDVRDELLAEIPDNFGVQEVPIYVYNISTQEFNGRRPPNHPTFLFRACPPNQPYLLVGSETHPFREAVEDQNGNRSFRFTNGFTEVSRLLNPRNPGLDQNYDDPGSLNVNDNLNQRGLFWSRNNPPLESELAAARARMEKTYRAELERMSAIEAKSPDDARNVATKTSHAAATYFGVSTSWHRSDLIPKSSPAGQIDCPNCGEKIVATTAVCRHCDAVLDEEKARKLFPDRFPRGPGRPKNEAAA